MPGATLEIKAKPQPAPAATPPEPKAEEQNGQATIAYPTFRAVVFGDACGSTHEQRLAAGWPEDAPLEQPAFLTRPAMTYDVAKAVFNFETEPEFTARMVASDPKIRESAARFSDAVLRQHKTQVLMVDEDGNKCVSWNNKHNRPFNEEWARRFAQEHLGGWWTFNGETISIGQEGNALSAQKRLMGFILACQKWRKDPSKYPNWPTEPVMSCMIVAGVPENPETIRTLDNGQPRTDADTIVAIDEHCLASWSPADRKEYGRMLDKASDFLFRRTGAGEIGGEKVYQTPSEMAAFRANHDRIHKAVRHLFDLNIKSRAITSFGNQVTGLSAGESGAMLFLMGCAKSDPDKYRAKQPRSQDGLDWSLWDKAKEFWDLLSKAEVTDEKTGKKSPESQERRAVRAAFAALCNPDTGNQGRPAEKLVVICKAWELFAAGKKFAPADLKPDYVERNGKTVLDPDQTCSFGGIDLAQDDEPEADAEPVQTPEQIRTAVEAEKAKRRKEAEAQTLAAAAKTGASLKPDTKAEQVKAANAALLKQKNEANKAGKPKIKLKGGTGK